MYLTMVVVGGERETAEFQASSWLWLDTSRETVSQRSDSPPDVVGQQREVEAERQPLGRAEEHHAEEEVDEVLWQHQLEGTKGRRVRKVFFAFFLFVFFSISLDSDAQSHRNRSGHTHTRTHKENLCVVTWNRCGDLLGQV